MVDYGVDCRHILPSVLLLLLSVERRNVLEVENGTPFALEYEIGPSQY